MLRYLTAGESHGQALVAIIEGLPAGLALSAEDINVHLARRQKGYGRGRRMQIESDQVRLLSGVRFGMTLGSPVAMEIVNLDWPHWQERMDPAARTEQNPTAQQNLTAEQIPATQQQPSAVTRPRPGHADLAGALKYKHNDVRNILERASARETAMRVVVGSVARRLLQECGISIYSHVVRIGHVEAHYHQATPSQLHAAAESNDVRSADPNAVLEMRAAIDAAREKGDSLGGVFEVLVEGVPPGLGSHVQWDRKLDGRLAQALMSIQAIKGVEVGLGFATATRPGSQVHDPIGYNPNSPYGFIHTSNNAGGIEGGMSNGECLVLRAAMKPIATLYKPLASVDLITKEPFEASIERSDICAVPAAAVVGEAVVACEIAAALLEKCGGDSITEVKRNLVGYIHDLA